MTYSKIFFLTITLLLAALTLTILWAGGARIGAGAAFLVATAITAAALAGRVSGTLADRFARLAGATMLNRASQVIAGRLLGVPVRRAPLVADSGRVIEQPYEDFSTTGFKREFESRGGNISVLNIDPADFSAYLQRAQYPAYHPDYYKGEPHFLAHKQIQHFVSLLLCPPRQGQTWMDVASSSSPFPEILTRLYGLKVFRQDLSYPSGVHGLRVGSNGAAIPLESASIDSICLHCSFEHFEQSSDSDFIMEGVRLLAPGGFLAIIPLYVSDTAQILTNPRHWLDRGIPRDGTTQITLSNRYWESHGRFYDHNTLSERVLGKLSNAGVTWDLMQIVPPASVVYPPFFALRITKPV